MRDPATGNVYVVEEEDVEERLRDKWVPETATGRAERVTQERLEDEYGGISGKIAAGGAGVLRGATLGLSDVAFDAIGEGDEFAKLRDVNPEVSTVTEIAGGVGAAALSGGSTLGSTPGGLIARAGARVAKSGEGASAAVRAGKLVAGGALEGGADAIGQAITQATLYDNPLDIETLGSQILSNGLLGGGANIAAAGAGKALRAAKGKLDDIAATSSKLGTLGEDAAEDLGKLDAAGLRKAEKAELAAIEEGRVGQRAQVADEIKAHRTTAKDEKLFLATQNAKAWEGVDEGLKKEVREVGKLSLEADKAIDRALRNPKALASNPRRALDALQQQESALETLIKRRPELETVFAVDTTKARAQALDAAERALQRNRDLQTKIADLSSAPSSQRLEQITAARDALTSAPGETFASKMAGGTAYSVGSSIVGSIPFVGGFLAPFAGAASANAVTGKLKGVLANATAEAARRSSTAIGAFLDVGAKVAPVAPVLATRTLQAVRYATDEERPRPPKAEKKRPRLAEGYKRVTDELKQQVTYQAGVPKMRPEARAQVAQRLAPIALENPILADRLETLEARKREYLARAMPRRPDLVGIPIGPDTWQPSEFEMRSFAAKVAAAEDPHGVFERLADGTITPEDAEVLREVYPELLTDVTQQILQRLPELQATLPYKRRLALSILTGVPVDPAMQPQILARLQASFANEANTQAGTQAPRAKPAFGSVKAHELTPAQRRQEGSAA
jgi:hypothetical protein